MKVIGHRGARGLAPEHTISSLLKGIKYGADELEVDVRITKDDIVVCHHDTHLKDAAGTSYNIRDHTFSELQQHQPELMTLKQALDTVTRRVPIIVEVKPSVSIKPLIKILRNYFQSHGDPHDILLSSFDFQILAHLRAQFPEVQLIVNERWSSIRATYRARRLHTRRIALNQRWLWRGVIRMLHQRGYELIAYTINDPRRARHWQRYGLYGVVTDYPDRFLAVTRIV